MKRYEFYKKLIKDSIDDEKIMNIIIASLHECDEAHSILRKKGWGWSGLSINKTAKLLPENDEY